MSTEEVLQALTRYTKETNDSERQTATNLGVNCMTLSTWLHGKEPPQKCTLAQVSLLGANFANFRGFSAREAA
jgi:transcriptional regulator with XRE-family HTH domain